MCKRLRFFEAINPPFFLESVYVTAYSDFECFAIRNDKSVIIGFDKYNENKAALEALALYSSDMSFNIYEQSFIDFLSCSRKACDNAIVKCDPDSLTHILLKFLSLYKWTEFFYSDYAYRDCKKNSPLIKKLSRLESIKTKGRRFLNDFFNGKSSFWGRMMSCIPESDTLYCNFIGKNDICISKCVNPLYRENHLMLFDGTMLAEDTEKYRELFNWAYIFDKYTNVLHGIGASEGVVSGRAFLLSANFTNFDNLSELIEDMPENRILVSETTSPDLLQACYKSIGIVTNQGGLGSHAALICRQRDIPCVVGVGNATSIIENGDTLTIDGKNGKIYIWKS